jgi:hypothetical protein
VPFNDPAEDLIQFEGVSGKVVFTNEDEAYKVTISWNPVHFPSLLLWYSNGGISNSPWDSEHFALGVEPICSAFGAGEQVSAARNPLVAAGGRTAYPFNAKEQFVTKYRIEAGDLD